MLETIKKVFGKSEKQLSTGGVAAGNRRIGAIGAGRENASEDMYRDLEAFFYNKDTPPQQLIDEYGPKLTEWARSFYKDNPHARKATEIVNRYTVGDRGYIPVSDNKELIQLIELQSRAENFTAMGANRVGVEKETHRNWFRDGEWIVICDDKADNETGFTLTVADPQSLIVENRENPHAIPTNHRIVGGIEIDQKGKPLTYNFNLPTNKKDPMDIYASYYQGEYVPIPASDVFHGFDREWNAQYRGLTKFMSALMPMADQARYNRLAIYAAQIGAQYNFVAKSKAGAGRGYAPPANDASIYNAGTGNGDALYGVSVGRNHLVGDKAIPIINALNSEIEALQSKYPHENFEPFNRVIGRAIASAFDIPYPLLFDDWAGLSFSAGNLMMAEFMMRMSRMRHDYEYFCKWWLRKFIVVYLTKNRRASEIGKFMKDIDAMTWQGYVVPPADYEKAGKVNIALVQAGLKSRVQCFRESGYDPEKMKAEIMAEKEEYADFNGKNAPNKDEKDDESTDESNDKQEKKDENK